MQAPLVGGTVLTGVAAFNLPNGSQRAGCRTFVLVGTY